MFKKYSLNRLLILIVTAGFIFLLADTIIEHWEILDEEIMAFIPVVFSVFGVGLGIVTVIAWKEKIIKWMQIFLFASFIIAGAGFYFHVVEEEDEINLSAEKKEHEEKEKDKPLLAPFAFGGLAIVGLLGTARKWDAEVVEPLE